MKTLAFRRRLLGATAVLFALGAGLGAARGLRVNVAPATETSSPLLLVFTPGTTLRYAVAWSGKQRGRLLRDAAHGGDDDLFTAMVDSFAELDPDDE